MFCTGLSNNDDSVLFNPDDLNGDEIFTLLLCWRIFFATGELLVASASMFKRFLAGEYGFLFSLSINDVKSTKSSSIIGNKSELSCEGLIGHCLGLDDRLFDVKNEKLSDEFEPNL